MVWNLGDIISSSCFFKYFPVETVKKKSLINAKFQEPEENSIPACIYFAHKHLFLMSNPLFELSHSLPFNLTDGTEAPKKESGFSFTELTLIL